MLLHKAWTLTAHKLHAASISLHRACDYKGPNIAYGCTGPVIRRAHIPHVAA